MFPKSEKVKRYRAREAEPTVSILVFICAQLARLGVKQTWQGGCWVRIIWEDFTEASREVGVWGFSSSSCVLLLLS